MKEIFDCFDFCQWSLGHYYNFDNYTTLEGTIFMPDLNDLIETLQS